MEPENGGDMFLQRDQSISKDFKGVISQRAILYVRITVRNLNGTHLNRHI
jgi:hypothetical protein